MSTDFSIRPVGIPAPSPVAVPQSQAASNGVSTDLPASQSVTATDASAGARNDPSSASEDDVTHQAFFDREAASLVFQVVNGKNDQVVDQFPDEAVLAPPRLFPRPGSRQEQPAAAPDPDRSDGLSAVFTT